MATGWVQGDATVTTFILGIPMGFYGLYCLIRAEYVAVGEEKHDRLIDRGWAMIASSAAFILGPVVALSCIEWLFAQTAP